VAAVLAGAIASGGAVGGLTSGTVVDSAAGRSVSAKKANGKDAAKRGKPDEAWRRMGMRRIKRAIDQDPNCVRHSFGEVRGFFLRTPCRSLDRTLFTVGDDNGKVVVVSVAWVGMHSRGQARRFKTLDDTYGTGNIMPLAGALLDIADVRFTGRHYDSRQDRNTVVVAEAEPISGRPTDDELDAIAEIAIWLPRTGK
jgi:hypothetical protein